VRLGLSPALSALVRRRVLNGLQKGADQEIGKSLVQNVSLKEKGSRGKGDGRCGIGRRDLGRDRRTDW
jgi:hypothetical protein